MSEPLTIIAASCWAEIFLNWMACKSKGYFLWKRAYFDMFSAFLIAFKTSVGALITPKLEFHVLLSHHRQAVLWNSVRWHAGFQLRELTAPGELSLVRVARDGGRRQEQHGRDVRLLFHVLLECHRCVVGVKLNDVLVEGSGLQEFRVRVSSASWDNTSLRSLKLVSLFSDYRFIQGDLFADLCSMNQLRELVISATGKAVSRLVDLVRSLLRSASLSALSLSGLCLNRINSQLLVKALQRNRTVTDLSVHSSILHSWKSKGVPWFSVYLKESTTLSALTLEGMSS
ncbi:uncharacterized protein LOC142767852 [Rhipicephalus microplus]|uniref:uncharacterized protein LOC142767852 n=1 Tax=Rhipicephalus microplus TaxID=6941 RepID=UPI003F6BAA5D